MEATRLCRKGHPMLAVRGDGRPYCRECPAIRKARLKAAAKPRTEEPDVRQILDLIVAPRLVADGFSAPDVRIGELIAHSASRRIFRTCDHVDNAVGRWLDLARAFLACARCAPEFARTEQLLDGCSTCGSGRGGLRWVRTLGGGASTIAANVCERCHWIGCYVWSPSPDEAETLTTADLDREALAAVG
jgi:hypothetical protein